MNSKIKELSSHWNIIFHLYLIIFSTFFIALFLYAFFPVKPLPHNSSSVPSYGDEVANLSYFRTADDEAVVGRLVFMVIDALRSDFITGTHGNSHMPYLTNLIKKKEACIFTATANPPTVTMPRIKAMVTGTIPGFVDIILNLGSPQIKEKSFVSNLVDKGKQAIFYGDDTWLKLFPNTFSRSEGTSSFFVADYTEVDNNVTRHLPQELGRNDWTLMILHYLGLDHIGHLVGPRSSLVAPKLQEMDDIIWQIHKAGINKSEKSPQLLVVCGDHGMKDSGSHGGASESETHVGVAVVGVGCQSNHQEIAQVDLAPTLSVMLGLPIPSESVGQLIPQLLTPLSHENRLQALFRNTKHLAALLSSLSSEQESLFLEATKLHNEWLKKPSQEMSDKATSLYLRASSAMSSSLAKTQSSFDLYSLTISGCIVYQCFIILLFSTKQLRVPYVHKRRCFQLFIIFIGVNALLCSTICDSNSIACDTRPQGILLQVVMFSVLAFNFQLLLNIADASIIKFHGNVIEWFLLIGTILHSLGLGASSLVEEEHQVWYFLWTTLLILIFHKYWCSVVLLCLFVQRVARKLNQTGDKWAALPDIEDWLAERKDVTSIMFLIALVLIGMYLLKNKTKSTVIKLVTAKALLLIYLYRAAIEAVDLPYFASYLSHQGWIEARIFGCCLLFLLINEIFIAAMEQKSHTAASTLRDTWILGIAMLRKPHDVILINCQLLSSYGLTKSLKTRPIALTISHVWLGWVFYFYQGNSNSLASVDVAAGYVGLTDYQPVLVGMFLLAHTYSAPVLSQLLLLCGLEQNASKVEVLRGLRLCSVLRLLPVCVYLSIIVLQREHLFIWSVFAPKLLYETAATVVALLATLICFLCLLFDVK